MSNGRILFLVSPCYTNSMQCNNLGSCSPQTDYPYYQCNCYAGYTGQQCTQGTKSKQANAFYVI